MLACLLAILLLLAGPAAAQTDAAMPAPAVIDRVVAVVQDRIVTLSDVRLEAELAARSPLPLLAGRDPAQSLVEQAVVRGLAGEVQIYRPSTAEVRSRLEALRGTWPERADYEDFLRLHGLSEDQLAGLLFSRLVVERYLHRNIVLVSAAVGGADAQARYDAWIADQLARTTVRLVPARAAEP